MKLHRQRHALEGAGDRDAGAGPRHEFEIRRAHARRSPRSASPPSIASSSGCDQGRPAGAAVPESLARAWIPRPVPRLETPRSDGIGRAVSSNAWSFSEGWQKALRDLGTRNDILKQIHRSCAGTRLATASSARASRCSPASSRARTSWSGGSQARGSPTRMKGTFYAVIEAPNGFAYHLPLDAKAAEGVAPGILVLFGTRPEVAVRPMDRRIAETAREARGVYALDRAVDEGDRARVARRLGELEREGLVTAEGPGRWTVPADFIQRLESRPRTEPPRERLWVEKLPLALEQTPGHRGPVWLDQVDGRPWRAGGSARTSLALSTSGAMALRALGIAPDDPRRDAKLREVERQAVGEGMAARTRQAFLARTPDGFRGRVQVGPAGAPYAVVSDGAALRAGSGVARDSWAGGQDRRHRPRRPRPAHVPCAGKGPRSVANAWRRVERLRSQAPCNGREYPWPRPKFDVFESARGFPSSCATSLRGIAQPAGSPSAPSSKTRCRSISATRALRSCSCAGSIGSSVTWRATVEISSCCLRRSGGTCGYGSRRMPECRRGRQGRGTRARRDAVQAVRAAPGDAIQAGPSLHRRLPGGGVRGRRRREVVRERRA